MGRRRTVAVMAYGLVATCVPLGTPPAGASDAWPSPFDAAYGTGGAYELSGPLTEGVDLLDHVDARGRAVGIVGDAMATWSAIEPLRRAPTDLPSRAFAVDTPSGSPMRVGGSSGVGADERPTIAFWSSSLDGEPPLVVRYDTPYPGRVTFLDGDDRYFGGVATRDGESVTFIARGNWDGFDDTFMNHGVGYVDLGPGEDRILSVSPLPGYLGPSDFLVLGTAGGVPMLVDLRRDGTLNPDFGVGGRFPINVPAGAVVRGAEWIDGQPVVFGGVDGHPFVFEAAIWGRGPDRLITLPQEGVAGAVDRSTGFDIYSDYWVGVERATPAGVVPSVIAVSAWTGLVNRSYGSDGVVSIPDAVGQQVVAVTDRSLRTTGARGYGTAIFDPQDPWTWRSAWTDLPIRPVPSIELSLMSGFSDGSLLLVGPKWSGVWVARLTTTGVLDPTFGDDGYAILPVAGNRPVAVGRQPTGHVVVVTALGVWRLLPDGRLDVDFGHSGFVRTHIGIIERAAVQPSGAIVLLNTGVGRLTANGEPDPSYQLAAPSLAYQPGLLGPAQANADGSIDVLVSYPGAGSSGTGLVRLSATVPVTTTSVIGVPRGNYALDAWSFAAGTDGASLAGPLYDAYHPERVVVGSRAGATQFTEIDVGIATAAALTLRKDGRTTVVFGNEEGVTLARFRSDLGVDSSGPWGGWLRVSDPRGYFTRGAVAGPWGYVARAGLDRITLHRLPSDTSTPPTPPAQVPAAPPGLTLTASTSTTATVAWLAPDDRGSRITNYLVQSSLDGASWHSTFNVDVANRSAVFTDLSPGIDYSIRVAAVNAVGTGPWSVIGARLPTSPAAPTSLTVTPGVRSARLSWTAGADGGAAILDYVVEVSTNGTTWATITDGVSPTPTADVAGLAPLTLYWFRVSAINVAGQGAPSLPVSALIPADPAGPPSPPGPPPVPPGPPAAPSLSATPGNRSARLSWTAGSVNLSLVTGFVVQRSRNGGAWQTLQDGTRRTTTYKDTAVRNGVAYRYRIAAVVAGTRGQWSNAVDVVPRTVPGAPTSVRVRSVGSSIVLTWRAPRSSGGAAITDYRIQASTNGRAWDDVADGVSPGATAVLPALAPGTRVRYRVAAINAAGAGPNTSTATLRVR